MRKMSAYKLVKLTSSLIHSKYISSLELHPLPSPTLLRPGLWREVIWLSCITGRMPVVCLDSSLLHLQCLVSKLRLSDWEISIYTGTSHNYSFSKCLCILWLLRMYKSSRYMSELRMKNESPLLLSFYDCHVTSRDPKVTWPNSKGS